MNTANPYAAPTTDGHNQAPESSWEGLWRDNKDLVMHKEARLPNICVKSGVPVTQAGISRKLSWHNPWIALSILINIIVYAVLAAVLSKKATIEIPLSPEQRKKRKNWLIFHWILGLGSIAAAIPTFVIVAEMDPRGDGPLMILMPLSIIIGIFGPIVALIMGQSTSRILRPTRITDTHVWLRGVHENIIGQLPPLPPGAK